MLLQYLPAGQTTSPMWPLLTKVGCWLPSPTCATQQPCQDPAPIPGSLSPRPAGRADAPEEQHAGAHGLSSPLGALLSSVPSPPHNWIENESVESGGIPPGTPAPGPASRDTPLGLRNSELPSPRTCSWTIFVEAVCAQNSVSKVLGVSCIGPLSFLT